MKKTIEHSANYTLAEKFCNRYQIKFPAVQTLCTKCQNEEEKFIIELNDDAEDSNDNLPDPIKPICSFKRTIQYCCNVHHVRTFQPNKYQITTPISLLSENTNRLLKRKYKKGTGAFLIAFANTVCPWQIQEFLSKLSSPTDNSDDKEIKRHADLVLEVKTVPNVSTKITLMSTIACKLNM